MSNVSAGVYTKIIDLSTYVRAVPSSTGFIPALCPKGRDNQLLFLGSRSELISEFGEPNIALYGKNYGQGPYCAYNFLGESGSLYFMRVLPEDAAFSNLVLDSRMQESDSTCIISLAYLDSTAANSKAELVTGLETVEELKPIGIFYPIGRGENYNSLSLRLTAHSNPLFDGIFVTDIYEKQSDGSNVIIESFEVSFDPEAVDTAGDSLFITDVLEKYSSVLRFHMKLTSDDYTSGYYLTTKVYDKNIGTISVVKTEDLATITDNKQNFVDWEKVEETGTANYSITAIDARGNKLTGWLGASSGDGDIVNVFNSRDFTTQAWIGDITKFDSASDISYKIKKSFADISLAFTSAEPVPLKKGIDGSLLTQTGSLNNDVAKELLTNAYGGLIDDDVLDIENFYFNLIFDCGYPTDVKTEVVTLVTTRRDCMAIIDNGDNTTFDEALIARSTDHTYNNYYTAIHEPYNKVYDSFTGKDIWVSPIYHLAYLLPRNDSVGEQWYAAAGFTRGIIESIKEMRFNSKLGQRDQLYLKQINPIVKFSQGYSLWSQLTTQAKTSALQDINIVRLVLYVKRALDDYCKYFVYEQNDEVTWGQVAGNVVSFLEDIKSRRGLYSYQVEVSANDYEKKQKKFHVNVTLNPVRVVEKIELNFFIN